MCYLIAVLVPAVAYAALIQHILEDGHLNKVPLPQPATPGLIADVLSLPLSQPDMFMSSPHSPGPSLVNSLRALALATLVAACNSYTQKTLENNNSEPFQAKYAAFAQRLADRQLGPATWARQIGICTLSCSPTLFPVLPPTPEGTTSRWHNGCVAALWPGFRWHRQRRRHDHLVFILYKLAEYTYHHNGRRCSKVDTYNAVASEYWPMMDKVYNSRDRTKLKRRLSGSRPTSYVKGNIRVLGGDSFTFSAAGESTVGDLKKTAAQNVGMPTQHIRLGHNRVPLNDTLTLEKWHCEHGDAGEITLTVVLDGGDDLPHEADVEPELAEFHLKAHDVGGHGDCLPKSIAYAVYGNAMSHGTVREAMYNELTINADTYRDFCLHPGSYQDYCSEMRKSGTWGDALALWAAAKALGRKIVVVDGTGNLIIADPPEGAPITGEDVWLAYYRPVHYRPTRPTAWTPRQRQRALVKHVATRKSERVRAWLARQTKSVITIARRRDDVERGQPPQPWDRSNGMRRAHSDATEATNVQTDTPTTTDPVQHAADRERREMLLVSTNVNGLSRQTKEGTTVETNIILEAIRTNKEVVAISGTEDITEGGCRDITVRNSGADETVTLLTAGSGRGALGDKTAAGEEEGVEGVAILLRGRARHGWLQAGKSRPAWGRVSGRIMWCDIYLGARLRTTRFVVCYAPTAAHTVGRERFYKEAYATLAAAEELQHVHEYFVTGDFNARAQTSRLSKHQAGEHFLQDPIANCKPGVPEAAEQFTNMILKHNRHSAHTRFNETDPQTWYHKSSQARYTYDYWLLSDRVVRDKDSLTGARVLTNAQWHYDNRTDDEWDHWAVEISICCDTTQEEMNAEHKQRQKVAESKKPAKKKFRFPNADQWTSKIRDHFTAALTGAGQTAAPSFDAFNAIVKSVAASIFPAKKRARTKPQQRDADINQDDYDDHEDARTGRSTTPIDKTRRRARRHERQREEFKTLGEPGKLVEHFDISTDDKKAGFEMQFGHKTYHDTLPKVDPTLFAHVANSRQVKGVQKFFELAKDDQLLRVQECVAKVIRKSKSTAAAGADGLPMTVYKNMSTIQKRQIASYVFRWMHGEKLQGNDHVHGLLRWLFKGKGKTSSFAGYRMLGIPSSTRKILAGVWAELYTCVGEELLSQDLNLGFRARQANVSTADSVAVPWHMNEAAFEQRIPIYGCFADVSKAFDYCPRHVILECLTACELPPQMVNMLASLYEGTAMVDGDAIGPDGKPLAMPTMCGVFQGCPLSTHCWSLLLEYSRLWWVKNTPEGRNASRGVRMRGTGPWDSTAHTEYTISERFYADDASFFDTNLERLIKTTESFLKAVETVTGLKASLGDKGKTEWIPLGFQPLPLAVEKAARTAKTKAMRQKAAEKAREKATKTNAASDVAAATAAETLFAAAARLDKTAQNDLARVRETFPDPGQQQIMGQNINKRDQVKFLGIMLKANGKSTEANLNYKINAKMKALFTKRPYLKSSKVWPAIRARHFKKFAIPTWIHGSELWTNTGPGSEIWARADAHYFMAVQDVMYAAQARILPVSHVEAMNKYHTISVSAQQLGKNRSPKRRKRLAKGRADATHDQLSVMLQRHQVRFVAHGVRAAMKRHADKLPMSAHHLAPYAFLDSRQFTYTKTATCGALGEPSACARADIFHVPSTAHGSPTATFATFPWLRSTAHTIQAMGLRAITPGVDPLSFYGTDANGFRVYVGKNLACTVNAMCDKVNWKKRVKVAVVGNQRRMVPGRDEHDNFIWVDSPAAAAAKIVLGTTAERAEKKRLAQKIATAGKEDKRRRAAETAKIDTMYHATVAERDRAVEHRKMLCSTRRAAGTNGSATTNAIADVRATCKHLAAAAQALRQRLAEYKEETVDAGARKARVRLLASVNRPQPATTPVTTLTTTESTAAQSRQQGRRAEHLVRPPQVITARDAAAADTNRLLAQTTTPPSDDDGYYDGNDDERDIRADPALSITASKYRARAGRAFAQIFHGQWYMGRITKRRVYRAKLTWWIDFDDGDDVEHTTQQAAGWFARWENAALVARAGMPPFDDGARGGTDPVRRPAPLRPSPLSVLRCAKGHELQSEEISGEDMMCDECETVFGKGVALHGCKLCDHDVCNACAAKLHKPPSATTRTTTTTVTTKPTAVPLFATTMTADNFDAADACNGDHDDGDDAPAAAATATATSTTVPPQEPTPRPAVRVPVTARLGTTRPATTATSTSVPPKRPMAMRLGNRSTGNGGCMRQQPRKRGRDQQHDASGECSSSDSSSDSTVSDRSSSSGSSKSTDNQMMRNMEKLSDNEHGQKRRREQQHGASGERSSTDGSSDSDSTLSSDGSSSTSCSSKSADAAIAGSHPNPRENQQCTPMDVEGLTGDDGPQHKKKKKNDDADKFHDDELHRHHTDMDVEVPGGDEDQKAKKKKRRGKKKKRNKHAQRDRARKKERDRK